MIGALVAALLLGIGISMTNFGVHEVRRQARFEANPDVTIGPLVPQVPPGLWVTWGVAFVAWGVLVFASSDVRDLGRVVVEAIGLVF